MAYVRYVSLSAKSCSVWIGSVQLKQLLGGHLINDGSSLHTVIPQHYWGSSFTKIFSCGFFQVPNGHLRSISKLRLSLKCLECRPNLSAKQLHIALVLGFGAITNQDVGCANLLSKLFQCQGVLGLFLHRVDHHKILVRNKHLNACVTT